MLLRNGQCVMTLERWPSCTQFKENHTQRVNVARRGYCSPLYLFGRGIQWCPAQVVRTHITRCAYDCGNAKISEHRFAHRIVPGALLVEQNTARFQIAMQHPSLMSILNGSTQ